MTERLQPGAVRDAILHAFRASSGELTVNQIHQAVCRKVGKDVPRSSVRSYLRLNTPDTFERLSRGVFRMAQ